ncbi:MAG TPA: hypothetical protein VIQ22_04355, partial [Gammaproteobacteria bacterium]
QKELFLARRLDLGLRQLAAFVNASDKGEEEFTLDDAPAELSHDLRRAFDTIVLEVQRSLDYYESHFALPQVAGLVLAPLEQPIPGLLDYLAQNLDVPVRMLDLNALLHTEQHLSEPLQSQCLLPIGAALRESAKVL